MFYTHIKMYNTYDVLYMIMPNPELKPKQINTFKILTVIKKHFKE